MRPTPDVRSKQKNNPGNELTVRCDKGRGGKTSGKDIRSFGGRGRGTVKVTGGERSEQVRDFNAK